MFFAKFKTAEETVENLYFDFDQFHRDTFNPDTEIITLILFSVPGKDYQTRKENLRNVAVEWSNADVEGIYMSELATITDWFYRNGKRYGLLEEFRENAII